MNLFHMCKWCYFTWIFYRSSEVMWIRKENKGCRVDSPKKYRDDSHLFLQVSWVFWLYLFTFSILAAFSPGKRSIMKLLERNLSLFIRNFIDADIVNSSFVRVKFCHFVTFLVDCLGFNLTSIYAQLEFRWQLNGAAHSCAYWYWDLKKFYLTKEMQ